MDNDTTPDTPNPNLHPDIIESLHVDGTSFVAFMRKDSNGRMCNVTSVQVSELKAMLPQFRDQVLIDGYYSVNGYYRAARYNDPATKLPGVERKGVSLRTLCTCYVDIDCGRPSGSPADRMEWTTALASLHRLAEQNIIPPPSMTARSGRGLYAFWALRDPKDPTQHQRAWPEKRVEYKAINRKLGAILRAHGLAADPAAVDAGRVLRIPGSIHRMTGREVVYTINLNVDGQGFMYSLPGLGGFLGITTTGDLPDGTRAGALIEPLYRRDTKDKGSCPARLAGQKAVGAKRAQDILIIAANRPFRRRGDVHEDGYRSCGRRNVLGYYARFLFDDRQSKDAALNACAELAAGMIPPYPSDGPTEDPPIQDIVAGIYSSKHIPLTSEHLCDVFGVDAQRARDWGLLSIIPPLVRAEREAARPTQDELIMRRREFLASYLFKHHNAPPSTRQLATLYKAQGFCGANHESAAQDIRAVLGREPKRRPPKGSPLL